MLMRILLLTLALVGNARAVDLATTPLGIAAAALAVGQAAKFDTPGYQSLPWLSDSFYYGDGAPWNSTAQQIQFVASPVGGTPRYRYVYDVATDAWTTELMPWQTNGHGYDSNAVTSSGVHCFARYGSQVGCRQVDGTWVDLPTLPWAPGTVQALENLPGVGLVIASRQGSIAVWNGTAWANVAGAAAWGNTGTWATTVGNATYLGSGLYVYRLDANLTLTRMSDPPWSMGNNQAYHTTDGNKLLVARVGGAAWLEFDGTTWTARPDLVSEAIKPSHHYHVAFVPELGVIVTMSSRTPTLHDVWLVKVAAGAVSPDPPPPPVCVPQSAIPESFWGLPLCNAALEKPRDRCDQPGVVICDDFASRVPAGFFYKGDSMPYVENGMARFTLPAWCDNNCAGEYRVKFPDINAGGVFSWSFGVRADAQALSMTGLKRFIGYGPSDAPSCTSQQIVMTHMYDTQVPIMYRSCSIGLAPRLADGDVLFQQGDFDCRYRAAKIGNVANCYRPKPGVWADYYAELHVGHKNIADTRYVMHVREDGGPWRKLFDVTYALPSDAPFAVLTLTPYGTDIVPSDHLTGHIDYRNLIVATQPLDLALL